MAQVSPRSRRTTAARANAGRKLDAIIPARNEEVTISRIMFLFLTHTDINRVFVVVDPDTTDHTYVEAVYSAAKYGRPDMGFAGVEIIRSKESGKGQCVRQALPRVTTERVIFCDADIKGLEWGHISELTKVPPPPWEQTILVPRWPVDVPEHVLKAWPWVSGQRSLPTEVARRPELHGYLMEVQLNLAIQEAGFKTRHWFAHDLVSPLDLNPKRLEEMERDRLWGEERGVFDAGAS